MDENWSTQDVEDADISVGTRSETTEAEPLSERPSGSVFRTAASTLEVTLDSEGAVGCCNSRRALLALEEND